MKLLPKKAKCANISVIRRIFGGLAMLDKWEYLNEILDIIDTAANSVSLLGGKGIFERDASGENPLSLYVSALSSGDIREAKRMLSRFESELVTGAHRRVSGDLLTDAILDTILLSENRFALLAAKGLMDQSLFSAVQRELTALDRLNSLSSEDFYLPLAELIRGKNSAPDAAALAASAAWGVGSVHRMPKESTSRRELMLLPSAVPGIERQYGEFELTGSYFADEALEEMYHRFVNEDDWASLADSLWSFHAGYGTGDFLKYRNFRFDGRLSPLPDLRGGEFVQLYADEYRVLLQNAIEFMRDESAKPMLLCGGEGMGKTTMMLELTDELPKLRLVLVTGGIDKLNDLFDILRDQPSKFMVLVDNAAEALTLTVSEPLIPNNVLLAACSREEIGRSLFEVTVKIPQMQLGDEVRCVEKFLSEQNITLSQEIIRNACMDYKADTGREFSVVSARAAAEMLRS